MKNKRLLEYIPEYPKGVSEEYLAIRTGYIRPPYKAKAVKKGLKKMRQDIDWLTIKNSCLVERTEKLQVSTEKHLLDEGYPLEERDTYVYLSRLRRNDEDPLG